MEDYSWIEAEIEEFEQDIAFKRARLEQYQYDEDTTNDIKISICVSKDIVASLKKQLPVKKLSNIKVPVDVEFINIDAEKYGVKDDDTVFYFFNPFL